MIHKRKGVTLAEMSIVMAVIAIVSLSVVSFVMITSGRGTAGIAKLNAMEEIELVEAVVDGWFAQAAQEGEPFIPQSSIMLEGQTLRVIFPKKDKPTDYYLEKVKSVKFTQEPPNEITGDVLYFCTVTYVQEEDAREQTYIFCINPRVGETIVPEPTGATTEQEAQQ